ncbi:23S rRNA (adenine(1618)-N(6))-methyltransferase RlmF [Aquimarina sp. 2304DJ70-9]|uniref:23S rRNA (adenine(1618)-N(6))-methyltransferase RlmF n=1 Tax=Aquimarina penaris TaxID=3231044 RepID=UPI003461CEEA
MLSKKNQQEKSRLHPRNKNRERYDLSALIEVNPELKNYLKPNKHGENSVDFSNPVAVKTLNKALLNHYYGIKNWEFPDENLCPPIPGRADYIHHIADVLRESNFGRIPEGDKITCFDVGMGANCIYPILGVTEYGWKFIGSDIDQKSIASAQHIVNSNVSLKGKIECRLQENSKNIFRGIIDQKDKIDISICNPPFHSSAEDAQKGTRRKIKNLSGKKVKTPQLNFAGISNELIYEGGEFKFITNMITQSKEFAKNCYWFSTLVSKQSNLKGIYQLLEKFKAKQIKTIPMGTGNKSTRIVAWTFLSAEEQKEWKKTRWKTKSK